MVNLPKALNIAENRSAESGCIRPLAFRQLAASAICTPVRIVVKRTRALTGPKFVQTRQDSFEGGRALYTARSTQQSMPLSWLQKYTTCRAVRKRRAESGGCSVQCNGRAPFSGTNIPHIDG
jgi:hypothetical protein